MELRMIRWYDWVIAILAADLILAFGLASITGDNFWMNILYGLLGGLVYSLWTVDYCDLRKRQEYGK
jgi:uncharacterized membrane protein YqaE (UPF0057 family)